MSSLEAAEICVATVAYRSGEEIVDFLKSLKTATKRSVRVVVVDNSEQPDPIVIQACASFQARYLSRPDNPGFGVSSNLGLQGGTEPWVVLANPDLRFTEGCLDALISAALAHPEAAIFGPALRDESGKRYPTGRSFPSFSLGIGHALLGRVWPKNPWTRRYWGSAWQGRKTVKVDWVSGACLLVRRADWEALGGFDEGYFMYFEDTDLAWQAARRLHRGAALVGGVEVIHEQGATTGEKTLGAARGKINPKTARAHHESALRFLRKLYPKARYRPLLALVALGLKLRLRLLTR